MGLTKEEYQALLDNNTKCYIQRENGAIDTENTFYNVFMYPTIIPGSFNPLHDTHRYLYNHSYVYNQRFFEISIQNVDKGRISLEDINKRINQFVGYANVFITNAPYFLQKCGIFSSVGISPKFVVGVDVMERLIRDHTAIGVAGMAGQFIVNNRKINGVLRTLTDLFTTGLPANVSEGNEIPEYLLDNSSTALRAKG